MSETKTVWHPLNAVPYDPVKHAGLFDEDEAPELVLEGEFPDKGGDYLVTMETAGKRFVAISYFDDECARDECPFEENVIAWAELPEPYTPREVNS